MSVIYDTSAFTEIIIFVKREIIFNKQFLLMLKNYGLMDTLIASKQIASIFNNSTVVFLFEICCID